MIKRIQTLDRSFDCDHGRSVGQITKQKRADLFKSNEQVVSPNDVFVKPHWYPKIYLRTKFRRTKDFFYYCYCDLKMYIRRKKNDFYYSNFVIKMRSKYYTWKVRRQDRKNFPDDQNQEERS